MDALELLPQTHTPLITIVVRLVIATIFGAVIGIEREWRQRPAGLRTHMLVALAACVFTILTTEMLHDPSLRGSGAGNHDPVRIIEAVTAGVAFLAAGAIIQSRGSVTGLTTGAGMWLAGALGLSAGLGYYVVGGIAALIGLIVLAVLGRLQIDDTIRAASGPSDEDPPRKGVGSS